MCSGWYERTMKESGYQLLILLLETIIYERPRVGPMVLRNHHDTDSVETSTKLLMTRKPMNSFGKSQVRSGFLG